MKPEKYGDKVYYKGQAWFINYTKSNATSYYITDYSGHTLTIQISDLA
jgi:hypothetical protein